ncbi:ribonuclease [Clostridium cavendishii DSM 21758]|uniref:Ribonuclease n=1 Tax=Clostridium cavendishii DSM 21758 TaxID=1121302 RepID=A0A1M6NKH2_9CLOT|nr:ribonuclease [Clostridium cavendishii]SHJ96200.1 ribonuclease [Clostridium cavendishii DSM 21758]
MRNITKKFTLLLFTFTLSFILLSLSFPTKATALTLSSTKHSISYSYNIINDFQGVADYIHTHNKLPSNYITKAQASKLGWKPGKNLWDYAPGKSIGGDIFTNAEKVLPEKTGRVWRECDINYNGGHRGADRLLYSNDGLIYGTSDHYRTFSQYY